MQKNHFDNFKNFDAIDYQWSGLNLFNWYRSVFGDENTSLPHNSVSRSELKDLCSDRSFSDKDVFAAVVAWGGMRRNHGRLLLNNLDQICDLISSIRHNQFSREEAYEGFYKIRQAGHLKGMTAAYFTKLIFFCSPSHDGYIMDQWTSKSVNLLANEPIVALTHAGHVSDINNASVYSNFCEFIEMLSNSTEWTPEQVEMRLFCHGGKIKGKWRQYVINN